MTSAGSMDSPRPTRWLRPVWRPARPAEMSTEERFEYDQFLRRVRYFVWIKGIFNLLIVVLYLLVLDPDLRLAPTLVALIDGLLLIPYIFMVRRWPALTTYVLLSTTALTISAADFVAGYQTGTSGILYILLIMAGAVLLMETRGIISITALITTVYLLTFALEMRGLIPIEVTLSPPAVVRVVFLHTMAFVSLGVLSHTMIHLYRQLLQTRLQRGLLTALLEGFQEISGDLPLHTLLQHIAERAVVTIPAADRVILLIREADKMVIRGAAGYDPLSLLGLSPPAEYLGPHLETIPSPVGDFWERLSEFIPPDKMARLRALPRSQVTAFFPLRSQDDLLGLVVVSNTTHPDAFDLDTNQILELFAHQAAVSIENARLFAELQQQQRELQGLVAGLSKRLEEPVEVMSGFVQLLKGEIWDQLTPTGRDYLGRVERNSRWISWLIQDMFFLSRMDRAREEPERLALTTLVHGACTSLNLAEQGIILVVQEGMPVIHADPVLLWTGFRYLLQSAQGLLDGKASPRIEVGCDLLGESYRFYVRGNGQVLSQEHLERIFDLLPGEKDVYKRSGIGLAIARRIFRRYGGAVWAESTPGQGTTFYALLPRTMGQGAEEAYDE